jgi:uncharacterized protein (DUF302 family)
MAIGLGSGPTAPLDFNLENLMTRSRFSTLLAAGALALTLGQGALAQTVAADGIVRVKSAYPVDETVARIKADIAAKGIRFFAEIDQAKLAADAGVMGLRRSTLLEFGNPPLGTQFITARAEAGLDWPVRLLVTQDEHGDVWAVYTDFAWIAQRHGITNRTQQFQTASGVVASITSAVSAPR